MAVRCSVGAFPPTVAMKDDCGLPFGCVVRPFAPLQAQAASEAPAGPGASSTVVSSAPLPDAKEVARCGECYAYASAFCQFTRYVRPRALEPHGGGGGGGGGESRAQPRPPWVGGWGDCVRRLGVVARNGVRGDEREPPRTVLGVGVGDARGNPGASSSRAFCPMPAARHLIFT